MRGAPAGAGPPPAASSPRARARRARHPAEDLARPSTRSAAPRPLQEVETFLDGRGFTVEKGADGVTIKTPSGKTAKVVKADLKAGSNVVHIIDVVLVPGAKVEKPAGAPGSKLPASCEHTIQQVRRGQGVHARAWQAPADTRRPVAPALLCATGPRPQRHAPAPARPAALRGTAHIPCSTVAPSLRRTRLPVLCPTLPATPPHPAPHPPARRATPSSTWPRSTA